MNCEDTEELWEKLDNKGVISSASWPKYDEAALKRAEMEIVIQVNGKTRDKISVSSSITNEELEKLAAELQSVKKWTEVKKINPEIQLHMIGKLQTNKVKFAVKLFDYIHSVDNEKLAKKISDEQQKQNKKVKIFIQVNIGNEEQKSGVNKSSLPELYSYCKTLNLEVIGLMCIPPLNEPSEIFFKEMSELNKKLNFEELSMGMSSDYLNAIKNSATYVRIGSNIFGQRN